MALRMADTVRNKDLGSQEAGILWSLTLKSWFFSSWTVKWDVRNLAQSEMSCGLGSYDLLKAWGRTVLGRWLMDPEQMGVIFTPFQSEQEHWSTEANLREARRDRSCASPQLICLVTELCPCWTSVYPPIRMELCPSHMLSGSRKRFIKFHDLLISSWAYNETPGEPELGAQLVHWVKGSAVPSWPLLSPWVAHSIC